MHQLLAKQLETARRADGGIDLEKLTALVAQAYDEAEHDRERTDRSISLMVEELETFQKGLETKIAQRTAQLRESRRALKLQNSRMAAALDSTGYAISIFDGQKKLVYCNSYFLDLYHLPHRYGRPGTAFEAIVRARIAANSHVGDDASEYFKFRTEGVDRGARHERGKQGRERQCGPSEIAQTKSHQVIHSLGSAHAQSVSCGSMSANSFFERLAEKVLHRLP